MARTRTQRRRQTLLLSLALAVTLLVLLFARDIARSAHGAIGPRRSENRSFAQLANGLIVEQNQLDARLNYLFSHGQVLNRPVFAARLAQLQQQMPKWATESEQLRRPKLAHDVNDVLAQLTELRTDAYQTLFVNIAGALSLPWPTITSPSQIVTDPAGTLLATSRQWDVARWGLSREPGRVTLASLSTGAAAFDAAVGFQRLEASPSLALTRGIGIAAVSVTPSPLPAAPGALLLPPVTSVGLGVSVVNSAYVDQAVTLLVVFTPASGPPQSQTMRVTLGPLQSYAFVPVPLITTASERATLNLSLSGAPNGPNLSRTRTYRVQMSPSGN